MVLSEKTGAYNEAIPSFIFGYVGMCCYHLYQTWKYSLSPWIYRNIPSIDGWSKDLFIWFSKNSRISSSRWGILRAQPMKINEKQKQTHPVMKRSLLWQLQRNPKWMEKNGGILNFDPNQNLEMIENQKELTPLTSTVVCGRNEGENNLPRP